MYQAPRKTRPTWIATAASWAMYALVAYLLLIAVVGFVAGG
jgi:hypothetical protein